MNLEKSDSIKKKIVIKAANSVSFSSERLPVKKTVSKDRELYIKKISEKALAALS